ncbi:MAG: phosphate acyltransferase PlsX [Firmicutes bacterium]|nr:phosphate acyltransferase PlsX [Bacillota bacterium]
MRAALDAMGGDNAPAEIIAGGLLAVNELPDLQLFLVGPQDVLEKHLAGKSFPAERVKMVHAPEVIGADEAPVLAVRRKKDSSMMKAIMMVHDGEADVMLSAGNTGALMAGSLLITGRLEGVERPALTVVAPTFQGGNVVLLDMGANMDAKAEHLLHYGLMGKIYAREVLGKKNPSVALLNVGQERIKGSEQVKKAYSLMQDYLPGFAGNVEAREVLYGAADVVICDGFAGNIMLKAIEGVAAGIFATLKEAFTASVFTKLAAAVLLPALKKARAKLDYAEYGGAPLLGVAGACIKCHGSSEARAIRSAIVTQAYRYVLHDVGGQIRQEMAGLAKSHA